MSELLEYLETRLATLEQRQRRALNEAARCVAEESYSRAAVYQNDAASVKLAREELAWVLLRVRPQVKR